MVTSTQSVRSVSAVLLAIVIVLGVAIQNSWADLLIAQDRRVLRYDQGTGAFIDECGLEQRGRTPFVIHSDGGLYDPAIGLSVTASFLRGGIATGGGDPSSHVDRRWRGEPDLRSPRGLGLP